MKCIQVRFDIKKDEAEYRCLYIREDLRNYAKRGSVESCSCPELRLSETGYHLFLRGDDKSRDDLVGYVDRKSLIRIMPRILSALLEFDNYFSRTTDEDIPSIIVFDGVEIKFDLKMQVDLIKFLRGKI
jgi:hypothetical protein